MTPRFFPLPDDYVSRSLLIAGMFMFAAFFATAPAILFDDRLLNGVIIWWKPLKFWLAVAVHFLSLAMIAQILTHKARQNLALKGAVFAAIVAGLFENIYVTIQAARGRHSHFNFETQIESLMYPLMGIGALLLVFAPLVMGLVMAFNRNGDRSGLKTGAIIGLVIGPVLTVIFGGYMSIYGSHFYGAPGVSDAGGLPIVGWSTIYPDLRPGHFIATHMIQFGPIIGWLADRVVPNLARVVTIIATVAIAGASGVMFALAVSGIAPLGFLS